MIHAGEIHPLEVIRIDQNSIIFNGKNLGPLPCHTTAIQEYEVGDIVDVFIYYHKDELVADLQKPLATLGEIAWLEVISTATYGAFLNWGIKKDLFIPNKLQKVTMRPGKSYPVMLITDPKTGRTIATGKFEHLLNQGKPEFITGERVSLQIYRETNIGFTAIINHTHTGLIYRTELFQKLTIGETITGFIKQIREDGKIDLSLIPSDQQETLDKKILDQLRANDGFLPLSDKTPKEKIYEILGVSKKRFKKAIGGLYKNRKISIQHDGIYLITEQEQKPFQVQRKNPPRKTPGPRKNHKAFQQNTRQKPQKRD